MQPTAITLALILVLAAAAARGGCAPHPQDGPHADIRIDITDRDVRFNIGMNLLFADSAAPTRRELSDIVDPSEEAKVREAIAAFIREGNRVTIDGVEVLPVIEDLRVARLPETSMALFPRSGRAALTTFSVIASYPFKTPPGEVSMRWGHYPGAVLSTAFEEPVEGELPPMVIEAQLKAEGRLRVIRFSESEPEQIWRPVGAEAGDILDPVPMAAAEPGFGVPVLSVVLALAGISVFSLTCRRRPLLALVFAAPLGVGAWFGADVAVLAVGARGITPQQAEAVFRPLHTNVYRAFDYTAEDDIYDALAQSVSGDLLRDLYDQIRRGLVQAEQGGEIGRVTGVELLRVEVTSIDRPRESGGFEVTADWTVEGTVYHWGHSHAKTSSYAGSFRVEPTEAGWRIVRAIPENRLPDAALPTDL
jgi:hypothetical protein